MGELGNSDLEVEIGWVREVREVICDQTNKLLKN